LSERDGFSSLFSKERERGNFRFASEKKTESESETKLNKKPPKMTVREKKTRRVSRF